MELIPIRKRFLKTDYSFLVAESQEKVFEKPAADNLELKMNLGKINLL